MDNVERISSAVIGYSDVYYYRSFASQHVSRQQNIGFITDSTIAITIKNHYLTSSFLRKNYIGQKLFVMLNNLRNCNVESLL